MKSCKSVNYFHFLFTIQDIKTVQYLQMVSMKWDHSCDQRHVAGIPPDWQYGMNTACSWTSPACLGAYYASDSCMNCSGLLNNHSADNGMVAVQCAAWYVDVVNCGHQFGIHTGYSRKASHLYADEDASAAWPYVLMHAHTPVKQYKHWLNGVTHTDCSFLFKIRDLPQYFSTFRLHGR